MGSARQSIVRRQRMRSTVLIQLTFTLYVSACVNHQPYPPMTAVRWGAGICDTIPNSYRCAIAIEDSKFAAAGAVVNGDADSICFSGEGWNGCVARTMGHPTFPGTAVYVGTMDEIPYHVLWVQYSEGSDVRLVHVRTGTRIQIDDNPTPSPQGEWLAVAAGDLEAQYGPNRFTIWRPDNDSLHLEWVIEPSEWEPRRVRWMDGTHLWLERAWLFPPPTRIDTVRVAIVDGVWRLR
jgi:hypothetical protein